MNHSIIYFKKATLNLLKKPSISDLLKFIRYYPNWLKDISSNRNTIVDKKLWVTYPAINFIKSVVKPDMRVFEYGSGGSTLFWAEVVNEVISIEHEENWYKEIKEKLETENLKNVKYYLIKPSAISSLPNELKYNSQDDHFIGYSFESYVKMIDNYPDNYFDIIFIDGRSRPDCIAHSVNKVKKKGYLIIDNSERKYYFDRVDLNNDSWKKYVFAGPVPFSHDFSETSVFQRL